MVFDGVRPDENGDDWRYGIYSSSYRWWYIIILLFTAAARRHSLQVATRVREHATNNKQQKIIFSFFKDEAILIAKLTKRKSKAVRLAKAKSYKYVLYRGRHWQKGNRKRFDWQKLNHTNMCSIVDAKSNSYIIFLVTCPFTNHFF